MQKKLEIMTNVAIVVLCLAVSSILVKKHFFPEGPPEGPPATAKGEFLDLPDELTPGAAQRVMVAALAPACGYCEDSMSFYRDLSDRRGSDPDLRFVVAVRDAEHVEEERTKLQVAGVNIDQVVVADFATLGVPGTPMLIVADRRGEVLGAWLGKLAEDQEKEVLGLLGFENS